MSTTNAKVISLIKSKPIELLDSSVTTIQYYNMTSNLSTKGQALLEEWPSSPRQHLLEDWPTVESPRPKEKKRVRIDEYSEVRIFNNRSYISKKSYSKDDVDMFKAQIAVEARSLQNLISRFGSSTGSRHGTFGVHKCKRSVRTGAQDSLCCSLESSEAAARAARLLG
jgi:hypothetical protein